MLQKVDKDRLDKVLRVIQDKGIKFPVAAIEKDLGINKGNVSAYLKGKKSMSENFYKSFMQQYNKGIEPDVTDKPDVTTPKDIPLADLIEGNKNLSQANKDLAAANLRLTAMLESSKSNSSNQQHISASLEPILKRLAAGLVNKSLKDENEVREAFDMILSDYPMAGIKSGSQAY